MHQRLLLVPAVLAVAPALASEYLSIEQAQALIFPGEMLHDAHFVMSDVQLQALSRQAGTPPTRRQVRAWRSSGGGWFFLEQAIIKGDRIVYGVGLGSDGAVRGIEVLACEPLYSAVRRPQWLARFLGKRLSDHGALGVPALSGATLSSEALIQGVQRILAVHALFLRDQTAAR